MKMRKLMLILALTFIMCSGCVEAMNDAKAKNKTEKQMYEVTEILDDNVYFVKLDNKDDINEVIKWFDKNYSVYKINGIEIKYVTSTNYNTIEGIYITTRRAG